MASTTPALGADRPSDAWIEVATKMSLIRAQGVDGTRIGADARDGVVTLHGMVGSAAERTRAAAVAGHVQGVEQVRNTLSVVPAEERAAFAVTDAVIAERVSAALGEEPDLARSALGVHAVDHGIVVVAGRAVSGDQHRRALEVVRGVAGVRGVTSAIESPDAETDARLWEETASATAPGVERSAVAGALSDAWLHTRLKLRLWADPGLRPSQVDVDAQDGIVTLFGIVESPETKLAAERRALSVDGVLVVDNDLQVVPPGVAAVVEALDEGLQESVEARLAEHHIEDAKISVQVRNATVRLTGSVANPRDRMTALLAAGTTRGVRSVSDGLEVARGSRG